MKKEQMEIRFLNNEFTNSESRTIEGKAIVFNTPSNDLGGFIEIIRSGAVTQELIDNSDVFARVNHSDDYILARCNKGKGSMQLELKDDGVWYRFEAPNTEKGNELIEHIKRGEIYQSSFAFCVAEDGERWYKENGLTIREITKISYLGDIAPVFQPAYNETMVSLRALEQVEKLKSEEEEENDVSDEEVNDTENTDATDEEVNDTDEEDTENTNTDAEDTDAEDTLTRNNNKINKIKMNTEFRLLSAINSIANNKNVDEIAGAVISRGTEEMRKAGLSYGGQIQLPTSELRADVTVSAEGEDVIATELYDIIEPLRAKNVLIAAGSKFLTNLVGDVQVPIMGAGNVTWEGETASAKDAGYTFDSVKLSPKRLTAYVDISKQFLVQDSKSAEAMIRQDIINAINSKLESTILGSEAGTTTQPKGMFNGVSAVTISSFKDVCDIEAAVEDANVIGECKYIVSNKAKAALRNMPKSTKSTQLVMEAGAIDGTEVLNTSHVGAQNVVYGDFSNLAIGQWGGIDLTVDPYTLAKDGKVRLVVNAYFDAKVLREGAFAYGTTAQA